MDSAIIVIGLGSMGKRRIRNLKAIGQSDIVGVDKRPDRRDEVAKLHGIDTFSDLDEALTKRKPVAFVISVPPDAHHTYMKKAVSLNIPAFIEASVVDTDLADVLKSAKEKNVFLAPSCTLYFHPAIKKIKEILESKELGVVSNILYHSGQYLPDWHTYEHVRDYYVSNKATGGGREIVPFELTWITLILGLPQRVVGFYKKTIEIEGASDIDDTYNILLDYKSMLRDDWLSMVKRSSSIGTGMTM
jgi:predicted dehydrogenase